MRHSYAFALALAGTLLPAQQTESSDPPLGPAPTAEHTEWLKTNAAGLTTSEAGKGFDDLKALEPIFENTRVFGIGVGSPGTREFAQMSLRLVEYLVEHKGVTVVATDSNMVETRALDNYIQGNGGDGERLLADIGGWKFRTEEFRAMVEWLRRFNLAQKESGSEKRVHLWGIDMQSGAMALAHATEVLSKHDQTAFKELGDGLKRLARFQPVRRGPTATALAVTLPLDAARNKKLVLRGKIKTHELEGRGAGLWIRVDGPTPASENMAGLGPKGTTEWTEHSVEVEVPANAERVRCGAWMPDFGTAWFDALTIELDGKPWTAKDVDLDFEASALKGVRHVDLAGRPPVGFTCTLDKAEFASGKQSARLQRIIDDKQRLEVGEMREVANNLLDHFEVERDRFVEAIGEPAADWAIQNARVVSQWAGMAGSGSGQRAQALIANLAFVLDQYSEAKIAVCSHNLAMCCSGGEYAANNESGERGTFKWATMEKGSIEAVCASDSRAMLFLNLHQAEANDKGSGWLVEKRPFGGTIAGLFDDDPYIKLRVADYFDGLIWIRNTTATKPLDAAKK
jgi:erythromycin esterase-like protein